jgi:hypothetical protein
MLSAGLALVYPEPARAIQIPSSLSRTDLDDVTQILGHSTATKFLSNPYSLGGYSGFEVGVTTEFVDTTDLSNLGSGTEKDSSFQYNRISIGKGLFGDGDVFIHFIPFSSSNEVSEYGGLFKWNFYQAKFLPLSLSAVGHYNSINVDDSFVNEIFGWSLMGGITLRQFSLYWGTGSQRARSTFSSQVLDLTDPNITLNSTNTFITRSSQSHSYVGAQIEISSLFLAAQIDRYQEPVYSAKIGVRF